MINKDQAFEIHYFINQYAQSKLWRINEHLTTIVENFLTTEEQKQIYNTFLVKNGDRRVSDLEKSIYNMLEQVNTVYSSRG